MKKYRVEILHSATNEIDDITDYIAKDSIPNALTWYDNIKEKIRSLNTLPERCPKALEDELADFTVYHLIVGNYRAIYRIEDNVVQVLHVRGGGQEYKPL